MKEKKNKREKKEKKNELKTGGKVFKELMSHFVRTTTKLERKRERTKG